MIQNKKNLNLSLAIWVRIVVLLILILGIYHPVFGFNFVQHDDENFIVYSPYLAKPFSLETFEWMATAGLTQPAQPYVDYWQPITLLSRMVDAQLFGLNASGHHAMNLLYHAINTCLVFWLIFLMTNQIQVGFLTALLFTCHPLQVEAVVWITARKDLLGALFSLFCIIIYIQFLKQRSRVNYLMCLMFYILSLMPKPANITLPLFFLVLDELYAPGGLTIKTILGRLREKIPFVFFACFAIAIPWLSLPVAITYYPLWNMIEIGGFHILKYFCKFFFPFQLGLYPSVFVYEFSHLQYIACLVLIAFSTLMVWKMRRAYPILYVGFFWFLILIAPLAMVNTPADRFTYFSKIGLLLIVSTWLTQFRKNQYDRWLLRFFSFILVATLCVMSYRQVWVWQSTDTLFENALKIDERNQLIQNDYGYSLLKRGRQTEALRHYLISQHLRQDRFEKMRKAKRNPFIN